MRKIFEILQYVGLMGVPSDVIKARQYKRRIKRGDIITKEMKECYKIYKSHVLVHNYAW